MDFAIEATCEPWSLHGLPASRRIGGQLRLGNCPVDNFDEHHCFLASARDHLVEKAAQLALFWIPELAGLSPDQQFDHLDLLYFAARRQESLWQELPASDREALSARAALPHVPFLIHSREAFDGWEAFLLRPPRDDVRVMVIEGPSPPR